VGGLLLMVLDDAARMSFAVAHSELPTGALCALFGAPLFAWALWQEQHQQQQGAL
jgi:ABC-type Fe3+-siderophore transport system permease subunit